MESRPDRARRLHRALTVDLVDLQRLEKGALLSFANLLEEKLYRELGYASIHAYGRAALGFSERKLSAWVRMASALERLPATREAVRAGELPWTKARELVSVATPENEQQWVEEAKALGRRELERRVKASRARPPGKRKPPALGFAPGPDEARRAQTEAATPLRVTLGFTPEQYARWEALIEQCRKAGARETKEELVLAALAEPGTRPRGRVRSAYQVIVRRCPDCEAAALITSRGEQPLDPATAGRINCDTQPPAPGGGWPRTLTPALRRRILSRDDHRCQAPGCASIRFLEVHHLKPGAQGGTNDPSNLITLCGRCHQLLHERGGLPGLAAQAHMSGVSARGSP